MKPGDRDKHFVLRGKRGQRRIASLPDQAELALQMEAAILEIFGQGGGIAGLLKPKTNAEAVRLNRIAATYDVVSVPLRSGAPNEPPARAALRRKVAADDLIAQLGVEFSRSVGATPGPQQLSVENFVNWLFKDVAAKGPALKLLAANGRALLDETDENNVVLSRGRGWWIDQIGLRRKKLR